MAYIAKTGFQIRVTNHEFDSVANITGRFQTSGQDDICPAGLLCVRNGQLPNSGYPGILNVNAWYMNAAGADAGLNDVYASNTFNVNTATDSAGNVYKVGRNTWGLAVPAGEDATFTKIYFDKSHIYRFGEGNFSAIPTEGQTYATIANGLLTPTDAEPESGVYFQIVASGSVTEGAYAAGGYYDCMACAV